MARSIDSRLTKIEGLLNEWGPVEQSYMTPDERLEFALSLSGDILSHASGTTEGGEPLKRFVELADLDKLGVRNLIHGLCQYGRWGSESGRRILLEWWAGAAQSGPPR